MSERIYSAPWLPSGRVVVVEDGTVVANGPLSALVRTVGYEPTQTDIYVNPADVEATKARWFECGDSKGRLN